MKKLLIEEFADGWRWEESEPREKFGSGTVEITGLTWDMVRQRIFRWAESVEIRNAKEFLKNHKGAK